MRIKRNWILLNDNALAGWEYEDLGAHGGSRLIEGISLSITSKVRVIIHQHNTARADTLPIECQCSSFWEGTVHI